MVAGTRQGAVIVL